MIRTDRYFINIEDGSVVAWTSEIESNYKFKEITAEVAMAIEKGVIGWKEVVGQIEKQITPKTLDEMIEAKTKMNVRSADLNLEEQAVQDGTQQSGEGTPFEVDVSAAGTAQDGKADEAETPKKARTEAKAKAKKEADAAEARASAALAVTGTEDIPSEKKVNL